MKQAFLILFLLFFSVVSVQAQLVREEVEYKAGDTVMKGYIVKDVRCKNKTGAVLVVHEWWGQNEYARKRADMIAELGYIAMAVDMYGDGKQANDAVEAMKLSSEVQRNLPLEKERFEAALKILRQNRLVDPSHTVAVGYCFGGSVVLDMARAGLDLDGVVSFYGGLTTANPAKPGMVKAKILVLNGADDPLVKPEDIEAFKKEMDTAGASYRFINYPGAKHAFTNPDADELGKKFDLPIAYNKEADQKSWDELVHFLKKEISL